MYFWCKFNFVQERNYLNMKSKLQIMSLSFNMYAVLLYGYLLIQVRLNENKRLQMETSFI